LAHEFVQLLSEDLDAAEDALFRLVAEGEAQGVIPLAISKAVGTRQESYPQRSGGLQQGVGTQGRGQLAPDKESTPRGLHLDFRGKTLSDGLQHQVALFSVTADQKLNVAL